MSGSEEEERFEADVILCEPNLTDATTHVAADREGLRLNHVHFATRAEIIGGATEQVRDDGQCRLMLFLEKDGLPRKMILLVPNRKSAQQLVRALGVASDQRSLEFKFSQKWSMPEEVMPWAAGLFAVSLCLGLSICSLLPTSAILALATLLSAAAVFRVYVRRISIVVGSDGVLRRRFGRTRFVRFTEISRVVHQDAGIFLELGDGGAVRLIRRQQADEKRPAALDLYAELLGRRLDESMTLHAAHRVARSAHPLTRRGRDVKTWLDELRAREQSTSVYRSAAIPESVLNAAFADGSLDAETRVGAAIALRVREGETVVPRLRVAAAATASPKLRLALEKIADGAPDEEIARRIEKLR